MVTRAPASAKAVATPRPIPFEPPVTSTRAPVKSKWTRFTASREIALPCLAGNPRTRVRALKAGPEPRYGRAVRSELRVGFVGCGAIAEWHWNAIRAGATRSRVTACIDPSAERAGAFAAKTGGTSFPSLTDAVNTK